MRGKGHPIANRAHRNQGLYPREYKRFFQKNIATKNLLSKWGSVDQIGLINCAKTHDPIELLSSIFQYDGKSLIPRKARRKRFKLLAPKSYNKSSADKITGFNPSKDKIILKLTSFGIKKSPYFKSVKNTKVAKKFSKKDIDFLYDEKSGRLYFNENGSKKGFGDGGIFAILKGAPDLSSKSVSFI